MTNKEIDNLLRMIDKNDIEVVKEFLNKTKEQNIINLRQTTFEKYICNDGVVFNRFGVNHGTILFESDEKIIFSNGYSIYNVNKKIFNLGSSKIQKNLNGKSIRVQHKIKKVDLDVINEYNRRLKMMITEFRPLECDYDQLNKNKVRFTVHNPYHDLKDNLDEYISFDFLSKEIETAEILLNNPNFMMDISNPVLYGESEIGKCYILGLRK